MIKSIIQEIPYERDSPWGYVLGVLLVCMGYVYVSLSGDKSPRSITLLLLAIHLFYMTVGLAKYLFKLNRPNNIIVDLTLNIFYAWRRAW